MLLGSVSSHVLLNKSKGRMSGRPLVDQDPRIGPSLTNGHAARISEPATTAHSDSLWTFRRRISKKNRRDRYQHEEDRPPLGQCRRSPPAIPAWAHASTA